MQGIDHYENFPVASWLCPPALRPAVLALYRFARTADDLADEGTASASQRLDALRRFRAELTTCLASVGLATSLQTSPSHAHAATHAAIEPQQTRWPEVFGPLPAVVAHYQLPVAPLHDLLDAFEQDVAYTDAGRGYASRAELLDYCRRSANPVGRLLLHLYGVDDAAALAQSDAICTALQLINLWQDRSQDLARGRNYLPQPSTLTEELQFARTLMQQGAPLVHRVAGRAGWELRLVVQGGLRILDKLQAIDLKRHPDPRQQPRPRLTRIDVAILLWRTLRM